MRYLTKALELDGSDVDALFFRGIALEAAGQGEAAIAAGRRFLELDPLSPMAGVLLNSAHWFVGRAHEGLDAHERGLVLDPENPIIQWSLGYTYALLGRIHDARVRGHWMLAQVPQMPYTVQLIALVEGMAGRLAEARAALATLADMSFDAHITFHLSESFAVAGDIPTALRLLEQAVEGGFHPHDYIAVHCPFLAPLRGMAEFDRIAARAAERVAAFKREVTDERNSSLNAGCVSGTEFAPGWSRRRAVPPGTRADWDCCRRELSPVRPTARGSDTN